GRVALTTEREKGWLISGQMLRLRIKNPLIYSEYLIYLISSVDVLRYFELASLGSTRDSINTEILRDMPVLIPPFPEQHAIAAFLDRETAKIDTLVEKKRRLISLLEEKRAAIISHAVTKGLDPDAPMKDSGVEWLGEIPAEWKPHRNGTLFIERDERGYPDLLLLNVSLHTGVSVREFSSDKIEQMADDKSTYKRAKRDDIVFNKMRMWQGAVGVAPTDGLVSPDYTVAIPRKNVHSKYFEYLFRTSLYKTETNRYSHGIVPDRNRLYWDQFKQMKSIYPPFSEQMEIVNKIDQQSNNIDCLINLIQKGIERLQEYRTALISAAVTGKIDVREASL
ncbi:MAG: restriction endonuclease subunit S, partial [Methanothrix sp.]|nr:restriction endonuclease subunit S [Methanothrix sp.]